MKYMNINFEKKVLVESVQRVEKEIISNHLHIFKLGQKHSYLNMLDLIQEQIDRAGKTEFDSVIALKNLRSRIQVELKNL